MNYISVVLAEKSLRCRTYTEPVLQLLVSAVSYPCHLRRKALNVILFLLEKALRDKHRHTNILMSQSLEFGIKDMLHIFPYRIAVGTYYHTALYACIFYKLCLFADVGIPLSKILVHRGYLGYQLFIFCHRL